MFCVGIEREDDPSGDAARSDFNSEGQASINLTVARHSIRQMPSRVRRDLAARRLIQPAAGSGCGRGWKNRCLRNGILAVVGIGRHCSALDVRAERMRGISRGAAGCTADIACIRSALPAFQH